MIDRWIAVDGATAAELPSWAEGGEGDRAVLGEEGIAVVRKERGAVARWSDVMGVAVADGEAFVMVPRRPPESPWLRVGADMLPAELAAGGIDGFAATVRSRSGQGGYRDARPRDEEVDTEQLERDIRAHEAIPGAVEVPTRLLIAPWSMKKGFIAMAFLTLGCGILPVVGVAAGMLGVTQEAMMVLIYALLALGVVVAILGTRRVWDAIDRRYYEENAAPRMLVLAPTGCMVAFTTGAKAFGWDEIRAFRAAGDEALQDKAGQSALVVEGPDGPLGEIDGAWFGAPLSLIVSVAEAYRTRARAR